MQRIFRNQDPYKTKSRQSPLVQGNNRAASLGATMGNVTGNWLESLTKKHLSNIAERKESSRITQSLMALMPEDKAIAIGNAPVSIRPLLLKHILSGLSETGSDQFFSGISGQQQSDQPSFEESFGQAPVDQGNVQPYNALQGDQLPMQGDQLSEQEQAPAPQVAKEKAPDITKDPAFIELKNHYQSGLKENKFDKQDKKAFNTFFSNPSKSSYDALLKHTKKADQSLPDDPASISKHIKSTLNAGKKIPKNINKILSGRGYDKKMIDLMKARELTPKIVDYFLFHSDESKPKAVAMAKRYGFNL